MLIEITTHIIKNCAFFLNKHALQTYLNTSLLINLYKLQIHKNLFEPFNNLIWLK